MKILKKFEENLEYLGFDMAPLAWDIAKIRFESDDDRYAMLEELTAKEEEAQPNVNVQPMG
jgi:hypothetical protein